MKTINITKARDNLYSLVDDVNFSSEPIVITNNSGRNAVILSESDWNSLNTILALHAKNKEG